MATNWLDRINTNLTITTGDGASYTPDWMNATKKKEYNIAEFNFKYIDGSLVKRGTQRGRQYQIEIIFSGTDNIDQATTFEASADYYNKKTGFAPGWTISHPFYGSLFVQPISLTFDDTQFGRTIITGTIVETLTDTGVSQSDPNQVNAPSIVAAQSANTNNSLNNTYVAAVPNIDPTSLQTLAGNIKGVYQAITAKINGYQNDVNNLMKAYNNANSVLNTTIYDTQQIISAATTLIMTPATFTDTVINRLAMFQNQLAGLAQDIAPIVNFAYGLTANTQALKKLYENNAGTAISGMCLTCLTNITTDYQYRPDVVNIIDQLISSYNGYIASLQLLQTPNGGQTNSYIPDPDSITGLNLMVNYVVSALLNISAGAKQQRTYILPYDNNLILITDLLYGPDPDDSLKAQLIANNGIGLSELLVIKKGRKLLYYV